MDGWRDCLLALAGACTYDRKAARRSDLNHTPHPEFPGMCQNPATAERDRRAGPPGGPHAAPCERCLPHEDARCPGGGWNDCEGLTPFDFERFFAVLLLVRRARRPLNRTVEYCGGATGATEAGLRKPGIFSRSFAR